ncbi:MAG: adenosylcobinamide-GDP ribazoletransferase [Paracoccaceae bacterium]
MTPRFNNLDMQAHDIWAAFSLLSRLPVPVDHARSGARGAGAAWAYPIVGAAIGMMAGCIGVVGLWLGLPGGMVAAFVLTVLALISGGMHEDGLADFADGVGGGRNVTQRLEIMKDSRIGAYGAIALCLALLARGAGIAALEGWGMVAALALIGAISRSAVVLLMHIIPPARPEGLSASTGKPAISTLLIALFIALFISILCAGLWGGLIFALSFLGIIPVYILARRNLGGQTGDVLGAAQQCVEIASLAAILAISA